MSEPKSQSVTLRLPLDLIERIDAITESETERTGYQITRAEWIRVNLARAAAAFEPHHLASPEAER